MIYIIYYSKAGKCAKKHENLLCSFMTMVLVLYSQLLGSVVNKTHQQAEHCVHGHDMESCQVQLCTSSPLQNSDFEYIALATLGARLHLKCNSK